MTRLIPILILSLLSFGPARAADTDSYAGLPVVAVESPVFGKADLARFQKALGITPGQPLDLRRVDEGVRQLHAQNKVQTLFVDAERSGSGVKITLRGERTRYLRKYGYAGVETEVLDEVKRKAKLEIGDSIDSRSVGIVRDRLKLAYEARGYYFADVQATITDVPDSDEADVDFTVAPGKPTLVGKVTISGVPPELAARLREKVTLKPGDRYTKGALDESTDGINRYLRANQYPTSKVDDAALSFSPDKLSVDVTFLVRLGERYQFLFIGNVVFDDVALRPLLTEEVLAQSDAAEKIASLIETKYKSVGYHFVKVSPKIQVEPTDKLTVIRFYIREGPKVIIDELSFTGSDTVAGESLRSLFYKVAPGVLARGIYWEEGMPQAVDGLRREVQARGFLTASLSGPRAIFSEDKKGVQLLFDLDLGTRTFVGRIDTEQARQMPRETVLEALGLKEGEPLNRAKVEDARKALLVKYQALGYVDAKFEEGENEDYLVFSNDRKSADIKIRVNTGPRYKVGKIVVEGNRKTREEVILREMSLKPGDDLDPAMVRKSEEDVSVLGLFQRVEIVPVNSASEPGSKDLKVLVKETPPGVGEVGIGAYYEEPTLRLRTFSSLAYRNVLGLNQTASVRGELAFPYNSSNGKFAQFIEYAAIVGYRAPYPFDLPFNFSASGGFDSFQIAAIGPLIQTRARIEFKIDRKLSRYLTGIYRVYHYERTKLETLDHSTPTTVEGIGSTGPGVIVDFRDDLFNPTKGSYHTFDIEFSHPALLAESDIGFVMGILRNSFYVPLISPIGLTAFVGLGYAKALPGKKLPTARLANDLALGGQPSVRGFDLRIFSPLPFNPTETMYYNARLEVTSYLFSNISAAVFFDTGEIIPNAQPQGRNDGVGLGLRYKTPVGPIVFDVAQGLGKNRSGVRFYFTVGTL